ncbi:hypothetical protein RBH94_02415 [Aestuariibaculum sp. YM273]|uniref:hypothetical protein n=1 Tax=Aestuariibaculum sp. YM273 TaxID=3070659 RepID=UPI0027DE22C0|nr:hypothetical protein [Aestuariibaculum sp. YM273]WMI66022.1 hypothetical protein RBH94_02415 [Aestuariibaculum sp. YM273]
MRLPIYVMLLLGGLSVISCSNSEDDLEWTNTEVDRVATQMDTNNPDVVKIYDTYNTGVLYEYDRIMDFAYVAGSKTDAEIWGNVEIPQLKSKYSDSLGNVLPENEEEYKMQVESAVTFIDTTLFKYFKPNSIISELMPHKVLLSNEVYLSSRIYGEVGAVLTESESRNRYSAQFAQKSIYNKHSIVFEVNPDQLTSTSVINKYKRDNFYVMLSRIMDMHGLYGQIPATFTEGKGAYYGREIGVVYREELEIGEEKRVDVIDKDWFFSKGFIDSSYHLYDFGLRTFYQYYDEDNNRLPSRIVHPKAIRPNYDFVSGLRTDFRSYLNEMIHRNANQLQAFPDNIKANIVMLRDLLMSWGVDIVAMNPALETLN